MGVSLFISDMVIISSPGLINTDFSPCFSRRAGAGLRRIYTFDYSADGVVRKTGCIIMHNTKVSAVLLDE